MEQPSNLLPRLIAAVAQNPEATIVLATSVLTILHYFKLVVRGLTLVVKFAKAELAECRDAILDLVYELTGGRIGRPTTTITTPENRCHHPRWNAYRSFQAKVQRSSGEGDKRFKISSEE